MRPEHAPSPGIHAPLPEDAAIRLLSAYSEKFGITIKVESGSWVVTDPELTEPVRNRDYTDLVTWLARTYGWIW
jgi:hypothetical protein